MCPIRGQMPAPPELLRAIAMIAARPIWDSAAHQLVSPVPSLCRT